MNCGQDAEKTYFTKDCTLKNTKKTLAAICLAAISAAPLSAQHTNLGQIDPATMLETYPEFSQSLQRAVVGVPAALIEGDADFFGYYEDLANLTFVEGATAPVVVYMHGSSSAFEEVDGVPGLKWDYAYADWLTEAGYVFVAPDAHAIGERPTYSSPVPKDVYETISAIRQAEIAQAAAALSQAAFLAPGEMYLLGVSEGGHAAARYSGREFKGRMILSWSCEPGYMTDFAKVGARSGDPVLNIVGYRDFYYGRNAPFSTGYNNTGNCANYLSAGNYGHSKVVIYPTAGHGISYDQYIEGDLLGFMTYWVGRTPE